MGKRKATKMALLKAGDTEGMKREIVDLSQTVKNLKVLLSREVDKSAALSAELASLTAANTKTEAKKTSTKKTSKKKSTTEAAIKE